MPGKWHRVFAPVGLALLLLTLAAGLAPSAEAAKARQVARAASSGKIRPAMIGGTPQAATYIVEFIARRGPGSITGHAYVRTVAVAANGKRRVTALFGFLPAGENYSEGILGTPGVVGYNGLDVSEGPTAIYTLKLNRATHARLLKTASRYAHSRQWYDLFSRNCNWMVGQMARSIGLAAPAEVFVAPEAYVEQLASLNGRRPRALAAN